MCCNEAPDAPDYTQMAAASERAAELGYKTSQEQLQWARDQWADQKQLLTDTLGTQTDIMRQTHEQAMRDRERFESIYQPLEDSLVKEFQDYASPERIALEQGRAMAAVQQSFDAQRENAQRQLEAYGIDPSQTRSQAMDRNARVQMAGMQAGASNIARANTEAMGRALRTEALNIGRGYPSQVAASYGQALQAGNSAVGNMNSTVASGANTMGTGLQWGNQGLAATQQQANIMNMGFQNQMSAFDARQQSGVMAGLGQLAGIGMGVAGAMGAQEGGHVPTDLSAIPGPEDRHVTMLADDEFVIPAEVVRRKGVEFFEKLVERTRKESGALPTER